MRKLVSVIQRHASVLRDIEDELDRTETRVHDQSQISSAIPAEMQRKQSPDDKGASMGHPQSPHHGVVFVGQNKIAIPKFDPSIIEKYNKLNIEGKLPHIVETSKFDAAAVKQQVKDMFREIKHNKFQFHEHETPSAARNAQSSSGIGNQTPFTLDKNSQDSAARDRQK